MNWRWIKEGFYLLLGLAGGVMLLVDMFWGDKRNVVAWGAFTMAAINTAALTKARLD